MRTTCLLASVRHGKADLRASVKSNLTDNESAQVPGSHGVVQGHDGFHSEENARPVLEEGLDADLPDNKFRKRDPAYATAGRSTVER